MINNRNVDRLSADQIAQELLLQWKLFVKLYMVEKLKSEGGLPAVSMAQYMTAMHTHGLTDKPTYADARATYYHFFRAAMNTLGIINSISYTAGHRESEMESDDPSKWYFFNDDWQLTDAGIELATAGDDAFIDRVNHNFIALFQFFREDK